MNNEPVVYRWAVTEYTPGYLPDNQPYLCETKREAGDIALELKRELIDLGYKVDGTRLDGYVAYRPDDPNGLGRVIAIEPYEAAVYE